MGELKRLLSYIDLTRLHEADTEASIIALCQKAITPYGAVAAVCIYPQFVALAKGLLNNTPVSLATVINFPYGDQSIDQCAEIIQAAIKAGADEFDIVLPYYLLKKDETSVLKFLLACRQLTENKILKIIIESGILTAELIEKACELCIHAEVDFIKTSTGKVKTGATIAAATLILNKIKKSGKPIGIKVSGGISEIADAVTYLNLIETRFSKKPIDKTQFRIGASQLLDKILLNI